ncbi:disulfide bond formation protein [Erythrobacter sp. SG61-1L]|uniref:disulfide bond formation protein B n=1 Tax=Erythrobacter sp. SG61-1L TaxID=1603897 RepID=UPI0006C92F69|nr:disulfide bond formation protein B [Erythrobacter sp. SG61-1L]KPL69036.1 disulfide bond formation protein [Erythrobacter sp. SG61-1L]
MATGKSLTQAHALALGVPVALLAGAYISEYGFGLYPCEMCWWQRYAHFAAVVLGLLAFVLPPKRLWVGLTALAVLVSGLIGAYHAGVEYGWWEGFTTCSSISSGGADPLDAIMSAPIIRCDVAQWELFGISLAGYNFLISTAGALLALALLRRKA